MNRPVFRSFSLFHVLFSLTFCYSTICLFLLLYNMSLFCLNLFQVLSLLFLKNVPFILYMIFQICTFSCKANIYFIPSFSRSYISVYSLSFCLLFSEWRGQCQYLLSTNGGSSGKSNIYYAFYFLLYLITFTDFIA